MSPFMPPLLCTFKHVSHWNILWLWPWCSSPTATRQLLRTDRQESLQLFLHRRRGELLIECEHELPRLLIWPWLEQCTPGAGCVCSSGETGGVPALHPSHPRHTPLCTVVTVKYLWFLQRLLVPGAWLSSRCCHRNETSDEGVEPKKEFSDLVSTCCVYRFAQCASLWTRSIRL